MEESDLVDMDSPLEIIEEKMVIGSEDLVLDLIPSG
jgi:hypothetical protein